MNVLVDTSVWSLALRKKKITESDLSIIQRFIELIQDLRVNIIGPIRQEILSGIASNTFFQNVSEKLESFEDLSITSSDYVRAAEMFNLCRKKGIQGSHIDFLICAVAEQHHLSIFTLDNDFTLYSKHIPLILF